MENDGQPPPSATQPQEQVEWFLKHNTLIQINLCGWGFTLLVIVTFGINSWLFFGDGKVIDELIQYLERSFLACLCIQCDPFIWKHCNYWRQRIIFSNQIYSITPPKRPMGYISFMLQFFVRWTVWPWQSKIPHF